MAKKKNKRDEIQLDWHKILRYGFILFLIAAISTLLLALTNMATEARIVELQEESNLQAQKQIQPTADQFVAINSLDKIKSEMGEEGDIISEIDYAYSQAKLVGYTVTSTPNGYGGEILLLTGYDLDNKITGISILDQSETAGLGARSTEPEFQEQFKGLNADEDVVVEKNNPPEGNEIEAISGATITSTAVVDGVNASNKAIEDLERQIDEQTTNLQ